MSFEFFEQGSRGRRRWLYRSAEIFAALSALAFVVLIAATIIPSGVMRQPTVASSLPAFDVGFQLCSGSSRINCVVDGDTIWLQGEKIRIADIDTPEVFSPECGSERKLGEQASGRLLQLLNAGPFQVVASGARDEDRYGRKLRMIVRDGHSLGETLVDEGLAHRWGGARLGWCDV